MVNLHGSLSCLWQTLGACLAKGLLEEQSGGAFLSPFDGIEILPSLLFLLETLAVLSG